MLDEADIFLAAARSGARCLVIGRQALILLGIPVMTHDFDFWIHIDDIEKFNRAFEEMDFVATVDAANARKRGRYVLENSEHVDVLVARAVSTTEGRSIDFEGVWSARQTVLLGDDVKISIPSLEDLIQTKRFGGRPKDAEDIRLLEILRSSSNT